MKFIETWIESLLVHAGISASVAIYLRLLMLLLLVLMIAAAIYFISKKIVVNYLYSFVKRKRKNWDYAFAEKKIFKNLAHILAAIFIRISLPLIFKDFSATLPAVIRITDAYLIIVSMIAFVAFIKVAEQKLAQSPTFIDKPIASYFQLFRIILYIITGIIVLSVLLGKSPIYFLGAFGAMSAILLLIFKDTILGLVASVQIATNDMVRVGDWVEMPKYNADGDVLAINLNTVKVQNWDKTISTVPTYYFITESFKNWRGMAESGGRRIKRAIYINVESVKFVDAETRERYKKIYLLEDYIVERQKEIQQFNDGYRFDTNQLINGRRMTNIGVFREYIVSYLRSHPEIHKDMTLLVRQLATEESGVPIEIYCFTTTTAWAKYENIQSDIFDHLFAAASFFDLEIFQKLSGTDLNKAAKSFKELILKDRPENN